MGALEDLYDRVSALEDTTVKICRKAGHDEFTTTYPVCDRHRMTKTAGHDESCDTCGAFRCCEAEEEA